MRQVHSINENYHHYYKRKYGVANGLILAGVVLFLIGIMSISLFASYSNTFSTPHNYFFDIVFLLVGVIMFTIGIKLRLSRKNKKFSP